MNTGHLSLSKKSASNCLRVHTSGAEPCSLGNQDLLSFARRCSNIQGLHAALDGNFEQVAHKLGKDCRSKAVLGYPQKDNEEAAADRKWTSVSSWPILATKLRRPSGSAQC